MENLIGLIDLIGRSNWETLFAITVCICIVYGLPIAAP